MAEELIIAEGCKEDIYRTLVPQIASLAEAETDLIAFLANCASAIHFTFRNLWTGFYIVREDVLVLGPFQGPLACTRIRYGKGVCGTAWKEGKSIVVEDVDKFPGHIACSSSSRSEIVVPVIREGKVVAVLDIDSSETGSFDETDRVYLEQICDIAKKFFEYLQ